MVQSIKTPPVYYIIKDFQKVLIELYFFKFFSIFFYTPSRAHCVCGQLKIYIHYMKVYVYIGKAEIYV